MTKLTDLIPDSHNANKGTPRGLTALDNSLRKYGAGRSILIDKNNKIIAGNKTQERAVDIGLEDVIVVETDGSKLVAVKRTDLDLDNDPNARALAYFDNRVGQLDLEWDIPTLEFDLSQGLDLDGLFSELDLKEMGIGGGGGNADAEPQLDRAAELQEKWQVQPGELFEIGAHRLICGDCTDTAIVARVMGGEKADMVFTDPPYNVSIVGGTHDPRSPNFQNGNSIENDSMSDIEFDAFLVSFMREFPLRDGGVFYLCAPPGRTETQFRNALNSVSGLGLRECIVWVKNSAVFGRQDYHWRHESILYGWKEGAAHYFTKNRTDKNTVWEVDRPMNSDEHPTMKPLELPTRAIENSTQKNWAIFDGFAGSGTTLVACENLSRRGRGIEISPAYCAVILERMTTAFPALPLTRHPAGG